MISIPERILTHSYSILNIKNDAMLTYSLRTNIARYTDARMGTSTNVQKEETNLESHMGQILCNVGKIKQFMWIVIETTQHLLSICFQMILHMDKKFERI